MILSHPATGGFLTHYGWNSTLEGIFAGLPMIARHLSTEQFLNQGLVSQVLEISVGIDVRTSSRPWEETRNNGEVVKMKDVKEAVQKSMDGGRGAEERRKRAKELGEKAREAMEVGGSSYTSITDSIQYVKTF